MRRPGWECCGRLFGSWNKRKNRTVPSLVFSAYRRARSGAADAFVPALANWKVKFQRLGGASAGEAENSHSLVFSAYRRARSGAADAFVPALANWKVKFQRLGGAPAGEAENSHCWAALSARF